MVNELHLESMKEELAHAAQRNAELTTHCAKLHTTLEQVYDEDMYYRSSTIIALLDATPALSLKEHDEMVILRYQQEMRDAFLK